MTTKLNWKSPYRCWDRTSKEIKQVYGLDFSQWWVSTGYKKNDGERNSFKNEKTDHHLLMKSVTDDNSFYVNDIIQYNNALYCIRTVNGSAKLIFIKAIGKDIDIRTYVHSMSFRPLKIKEYKLISNIFETDIFDKDEPARVVMLTRLKLSNGESDEVYELIKSRIKENK